MRHRYILLLIILLTAAFEANATTDNLGFTTFDWNKLKIDSVLPHYTEVVPLESDYSVNTYTVSIMYPEFGTLTKHEAEVAAQFDDEISEDIKVESFVGVSRRQGYIDIDFVPIVKREGKYLKLISAQIVITPHISRNLHAKVTSKSNRYAAHSKLQSGKWVKISVTDDGMYRLTRSTLKSMGFSKPENVHLYGQGGHMLPEYVSNGTHNDDLVEVPMYHSTSQDAWLFWGNGVLYWQNGARIRNPYSTAGYYFLTEEDVVSSISTEETPKSTSSKSYDTFRDYVLHEKEEYSWYTGGRQLYESANFNLQNTRTYTLNTVNSVGNESMFINFTAGNSTMTKVTPEINGTQMSPITVEAFETYILAKEASNTYDLSEMGSPSQWTVKLTATSNHDARLDRIELHYDRKLKPVSGYVSFTQPKANGVTEYNIEGSGLQVMRIGEVGSPAMMIDGKQNGSTYSVTVADGSRRYVAFDESYSFPSPKVIGSVQNQDLHATDSVDMVIIIPTSGKLQEQAQRLADAHLQYDGLKVQVVRADQIYNEFSSGTPDATAYRLYMKMLYDKAENVNEAPRYLLLMGDCAWDNRMIGTAWSKSNPDDYLLCYESENSFSDVKCYVLEDYFGLLDDGEGKNVLRDKPDIGVGRFPVTASTQAKVMVDKSISFMSNQYAGPWKNTVYFLGDDGDRNEHMLYANDLADQVDKNTPNIENHKIMWDAYTRYSSTNNNTYPEVTALIKKQMAEGALVMNYTGHAATYAFSHEFVIYKEDFASAVSNNLPLWVVAGCEVMPFDGQISNIGEEAVLNPNGGALAFFGTTRTVYASQNKNMNRYFMKYLFSKDSSGRRYAVGDALRLSKVSIIQGGMEAGYTENKAHFCLLGDPAIIYGEPQQKIVVDSINSQSAATQTIGLKAGARVKVVGHIEDASGNLIPEFNGVLSSRLFDSPQTIVCKNNARATDNDGELIEPFEFQDYTVMLYESQDSISQGKFEFEFIMPVDITYSDESGRFVFYALNDDQTMEANGHQENIPIGGISDEMSGDTEGPSIYAYLNSEDFEDGGTVNSTPYFVAQLEDSSGISSSGNGVGHDLQLCIDGKADLTYNLNNYYTHEFGDFTRGTVAYTIPALEEGAHTLTFRAWDMLNNTSQTQLSFKVDAGISTNIVQLTASQNPAKTTTNFLLTYDLPGSECVVTMEVFDFMGRCLWKQTQTVASSTGFVSIPWNLSTNAGGRLGTGIYFYRCRVKTGESDWTSKTQKIIVLNNK